MTRKKPMDAARRVFPLADEFPMMSDAELEDMATSIATTGLRHPIVLLPDGAVLDGRNRLEACRRAGVEPTFTTYDGDDPAGFVLDVNVRRRNLTPSQKAMAVAAWATATHGGDRTSEQAAEMRLAPTSVAAEVAGISLRLVEAARYVRAQAPDLVDAVQAGTIRVTAAEAEARRRVADVLAEKQRLRQLETQRPDVAEDVEDDDDFDMGTLEQEAAADEAAAEAHARLAMRNVRDLVDRLADALEGDHLVLALRLGEAPPKPELLDVVIDRLADLTAT